MAHLTVDEILSFVSMTELNQENIKLSAAVNGHIRKCNRCLKLVTAFQTVHDELSGFHERESLQELLSEYEFTESRENPLPEKSSERDAL